MNFSLSGYSESYNKDEQQAATPSFQSGDEKVFSSPYEKDPFRERVFKPSESVADMVYEGNKRIRDANDKINKYGIPENLNFENFKLKYWKECQDYCLKYQNRTSLGKNDCWLNGLNDVIKNHPELRPIEQELTMCMVNYLLVEQADELKNKAKKEGHMMELMGGVDY